MSFYSSSTSIWWNPLERLLLPTYKDPLKVVMHRLHVWYWEIFLHEIAIDRPIQVRSRSQYYTLHSMPPIDDWVCYPPACKGLPARPYVLASLWTCCEEVEVFTLNCTTKAVILILTSHDFYRPSWQTKVQ